MMTSEDLWSVTQGCFETQLALPLLPARGPARTDLCGTVTIEGAFVGAVSVALSRPLAERAARVMFEGLEVGEEEVDATLLELTNMIGGNVKALLAQPSRLGLPRAGDGGGAVVTELTGQCEGEPVVVRVHAA